VTQEKLSVLALDIGSSSIKFALYQIGDFDQQSATNFAFDWLHCQIDLASIAAVGHRVVNGGANFHEPERVAEEMLDELRRISA
jgi:acetate kinase